MELSNQLINYIPEKRNVRELEDDISLFQEKFIEFSNEIEKCEDPIIIQFLNGQLYEIQVNWNNARRYLAEFKNQEYRYMTLNSFLAKNRLIEKKKNKSKDQKC